MRASVRLRGRKALLLRAQLAAKFSQCDWNGDGRLGLRALKVLIIDILCIPLSREGFFRLVRLLDDRIPLENRNLRGLNVPLANLENDSSLAFVTFDTFYQWWIAREGKPHAIIKSQSEQAPRGTDDLSFTNDIGTIKDLSACPQHSSLFRGIRMSFLSGTHLRKSEDKLRRYHLRSRRFLRNTCNWVGCRAVGGFKSGSKVNIGWNTFVREEAVERLLALAAHRCRKSAIKTFRLRNPPLVECSHCGSAFNFMSDYYLHQNGHAIQNRIERNNRSFKAWRHGSGRFPHHTRFDVDKQTDALRRWKLPCQARSRADKTYLRSAHLLDSLPSL